MSESTAKKRTVYRKGGLLDFPEHILERSKYGYKWRSAEKLSQMSDNYDPDGWELFHDKDGKTIKRGDLILAQMPKDMYDAMKAEKEEARVGQIRFLMESQAAEMEREGHEFRKKGGKIKFEFKQE